MKRPGQQNIKEKVILIVVNETELVDSQLKPNTGLQIHDDLGSLSDSVWQTRSRQCWKTLECRSLRYLWLKKSSRKKKELKDFLYKKKKKTEKSLKWTNNKKESCYKRTAIILTLPIIFTQHTAITNNNVAVFFFSFLVSRRSPWIIKIMMMCLIPGKSLYWIENEVNANLSCYISCCINFESSIVIYWHRFSDQDFL